MFQSIRKEIREELKNDKISSEIEIGIGFNDDKTFLLETINELEKVAPKHSISINLYSKSKIDLENSILPYHVQQVITDTPEQAIIQDFKAGKIQSIIRGKLSSNSFLKFLKKSFSIKRIYRLALLSTHDGKDFFFGPVGIDEGVDFHDKEQFLALGSKILMLLKINPVFFYLSAGRKGDMSRNTSIRESLVNTEKFVEKMKIKYPSIKVIHGEILIESAFRKNANVIIAPDGVSGNLIYRTLIHLGGGHSHGAFYINENLPGPIMDTSRVGPVEEYLGAIILALKYIFDQG
ncbi:MAG: hypothetical protein ACTSVI_02370 [Promethearchaeota archaeon]